LEFENKKLKAERGRTEEIVELENKLDDAVRLNIKYQKVIPKPQF
jgi:hypothetical protein